MLLENNGYLNSSKNSTEQLKKLHKETLEGTLTIFLKFLSRHNGKNLNIFWLSSHNFRIPCIYTHCLLFTNLKITPLNTTERER